MLACDGTIYHRGRDEGGDDGERGRDDDEYRRGRDEDECRLGRDDDECRRGTAFLACLSNISIQSVT